MTAVGAAAGYRRPMTIPTSTDAQEKADFLEALRTHRSFLLQTVRGLTDEQARQRTTVSELCLGGLIKHVTVVERNWDNFMVNGPRSLGKGDEASMEAHAAGFRMLRGGDFGRPGGCLRGDRSTDG